MTRSLHIIGSRSSGGAERFYSRLVLALSAAGHATFAANPAGSSVAAEIGDGAPQLHFGMRAVWDPLARWQILRAVRRLRPEIVQTYMGRATRLTHLPRGRGPVHVARLGGYYNLKGYRHAHAWIGNTRGIRDYLIREGLPAERVFHIGNFVDIPATLPEPAAARRALGLAPDDLVVTAIGRLHPNKAFDALLTAFARLPQEVHGRPVRLLLVGDGPLAGELHTLASQLELGPRVVWAGWQSDPGPAYAVADLFVCPSRHEPLGNVILEAWAHGKAVLSTASQGACELIIDGENGELSPVDEPAPLAAAMERLLRDEAAREALARAGLEGVQRKFTRERIVARYLEVYAELLASR